MNLPNLLACARILLTPLVMVLVLMSDTNPTLAGWAAALFVIAALTDFADGYLARRWKMTSTLGAFLDSVADKVLVTGSLLVLIEIGHVWSWAAFIIIARELSVMGLRGVVALHESSKVPPSQWGKSKAIAQFTAIGFAILRPGTPFAGLYLDQWVMLIAVAATLISAWDYFVRYGAPLRRRRTAAPPA